MFALLSFIFSIFKCPTDLYKKNSSPCNNGEGFCYHGNCPTPDNQCEYLWGYGRNFLMQHCINFYLLFWIKYFVFVPLLKVFHRWVYYTRWKRFNRLDYKNRSFSAHIHGTSSASKYWYAESLYTAKMNTERAHWIDNKHDYLQNANTVTKGKVFDQPFKKNSHSRP